MTLAQFAVAVESIRRVYGGWITSWGRTDQHALDVGGFANDPHTWGLGADMLYHERPDFETIREAAEQIGLKVLRETTKPHDHYQPLDFPAGPVTDYAGQTKTWT